jgi:hypothetical protein
VRLDHDPQWRLLQVQQLREYVGLRVGNRPLGLADHDVNRRGRRVSARSAAL